LLDYKKNDQLEVPHMGYYMFGPHNTLWGLSCLSCFWKH